jgi:CheY-like chemotaxis protein
MFDNSRYLSQSAHHTATADRPEEVLEGLRVLVLDDEPSIRDLMGRLLKLRGCRVEAMDDGAQALQAHTAAPFDLVIVDLAMPKMNGVEFLRRLTGFPDEKQPGRMIVTGFGEMPEELEELGVGAVVAKPFCSADLIAGVLDAVAARPA